MYEGPEFRHLRYFLAVVEECHIGRAAKKLHVSQPSLSLQIRQLEDSLGAPLFIRGPKGMALTSAGRALLPFAKKMLEMLQHAVQATASVHTGVGLPLRFGYSPFVNHELVSETLSAFPELVPEGKIEPSSECSGQLMTMVAEGHLEAALVSMPISDKDLWMQHICTEEMLVCLRKDDPLAAQEVLPKGVIEDRLRVLFARSYHPLLYDQFTRKFAKAGIRLRPRDFISAPGEAQFLVKSYVGLGLVRESVLLDPELTMRRIEGLSLRIKTAFICHPTQQRPVLQLLAYRLAKKCADAVEMNRRKGPNSAVAPEPPTQLRIFA